MAKAGLDFFPLDVSMDAKMELIEAEFGLTGFGVVVHLLQEIYGKAGYYIEWTEEVALLFARKVGLGGSVVSEIIEASIRRGMFDREKYDKYRVLTSRGIQKRYFEAVKRRKVLEVDKNILLVDLTHFSENVNIQARNVNILSENADISKQSKVEESKVKKSRVEESNTRARRAAPPSVEEVRIYCEKNGFGIDPETFVDYYTARGWTYGQGKPVKDWQAAVKTWAHRDKERETQGGHPRKRQPNYQPSAERVRKNGDWLDAFLDQQEGEQ